MPQPRWSSIAEWASDLRRLDDYETLDNMDQSMREALDPLLRVLLASDVMVITNGAGDYDSYLIPLGRLTNTAVVMDLGPRGPLATPWTVRGLSRFITQSSYVISHPKVVALKVKMMMLPPIVNFPAFSRPSAGRRCGDGAAAAAATATAAATAAVSPAVSASVDAGEFSKMRTSRRVTIGYVGRLATQKGPGMFVRAAAVALELLSRHDSYYNKVHPLEVNFVVAGIGPLESELHELSERLLGQRGVESITWLGHVPNEEIACVLLSIDVFVFSSLFEESFGMSPVEAMLMGVPVIGFGVGGSLDYLIDGVTGVLVQERSPMALGKAMIDLARDAEKRKRLSITAEEYVRGEYAPWNIMKGYERMYEEVMMEHHHGVEHDGTEEQPHTALH